MNFKIIPFKNYMRILVVALFVISISGEAQTDPFTLYEDKKSEDKKAPKRKYELIPSKKKKSTSTTSSSKRYKPYGKKYQAKWEISCYTSGRSVPGFEKLRLSNLKANFSVYQGITTTGVEISVPMDSCFLKSIK